jgi:hypothetical protein
MFGFHFSEQTEVYACGMTMLSSGSVPDVSRHVLVRHYFVCHMC